MTYEDYVSALKEPVEIVCNPNGLFDVYWDYDDCVTPEQIRDAIDHYKAAGYDNPRGFLEYGIADSFFSNGGADYVYECFDSEISSHVSAEVYEMWYMSDTKWEDLEEAGYKGIDLNIDDLLRRSQFKVNALLATDNERNYDFGSIDDIYGSEALDYGMGPGDVAKFDNGLTYVLHQQGHTAEELLERNLFAEEFAALNKDTATAMASPFLDSVVEELRESGQYGMENVAVLLSMDGHEMLEFAQAQEKGEGSITISKDSAEICIHNQWEGAGGMIGIQLEKDLTIPFSLVWRFQIEKDGTTNRWGNYTVDEVHGLLGSCWTNDFELSDQPAIDPIKEDYRTTIEHINSLCEDLDFVAFAREKYGLNLQRHKDPLRYEEKRPTEAVRESAADFVRGLSGTSDPDQSKHRAR